MIFSREQRHWLGRLILIAAIGFGLLVPNTVTAEATEPQFGPSSYLPVLMNKYCTGPRSGEMPIGVQLYGPTNSQQAGFDLLNQTGIAWIRQSITWPVIQPDAPTPGSPPRYLWSSADSHLTGAVREYCANVLATIDSTAAWAATNGDRSPIKPEFLDEYAAFVQAAVERYDGDGKNDAPGSPKVLYWEMYNEPDFGSKINDNEGWGEYGAQYAAMLKAIYPAVKAANPEAQVVFGGIAYSRFVEDDGLFSANFVDDVLTAGGGAYFDVMNIHHYPDPGETRSQWTESNSSGLPEKIDLIRAKLQSHGVVKPLIISEIGWHSNENAVFPSSPEFQARHVVQLLTQAMAYDVKTIIWWTFTDLGAEYPFHSGIVTGNPPTPKPSYNVFKEFVNRVGSSDFVAITSKATADNDLEAYEFRSNVDGKRFYVAWRNPIALLGPGIPFDDKVMLTWQVSGAKATVYTKQGVLSKTVLDAEDGTSDGKVTLEVGSSPIYVVMD